MYYVYMMTNWNNKVLYTGVTNNLERRIYEHKNKVSKGFTAKYNINKLVESINPQWKDLSVELGI
ncbi:MAG: GIY-YIG nuclease family protein [Tissierellia bacterium]|nr:GIY-YIG nuclease family protein [Tissierellia bacterium]MDD4725369.1 GIY-YIG nuclease family protein [Tissierellia bacterium]